MLNVWYVSAEPVADKGCETSASTSFTQDVDKLFDLDAMVRKYKNSEGGKAEELGDEEMPKETPRSLSNEGNRGFVYLLSSYL